MWYDQFCSIETITAWATDFQTPACNFWFISADAAQEKEKKRKKVLLPAGVSKSAAHT
jgi:hypothetical protein